MSGCNKIVTINHLYMLEELRLRTYEISLYIMVCLTTRSNLAVWSYSPVSMKNTGKFCFPLIELGAPPLTPYHIRRGRYIPMEWSEVSLLGVRLTDPPQRFLYQQCKGWMDGGSASSSA